MLGCAVRTMSHHGTIAPVLTLTDANCHTDHENAQRREERFRRFSERICVEWHVLRRNQPHVTPVITEEITSTDILVPGSEDLHEVRRERVDDAEEERGL